ncbi:MAG: hypothetical protein ACRDEA_04130 [Microcystaceae cyanobacterium]
MAGFIGVTSRQCHCHLIPHHAPLAVEVAKIVMANQEYEPRWFLG